MNISNFITDFKLTDTDLKLKGPHAISVHIGWLNWGSVGDAVFSELLDYLKAEEIAEFERPGDFYNFVAYRDRSRTYLDAGGDRHTEFANSRVYYARRKEPLSDLVLLNLLEPTQFGEIFVDRVVALMKKLNVSRYQVVGAMGSQAPHTRPLIISGRSSDSKLADELGKIGVRQLSNRPYEGPTSIFNNISPQLQSEGIITVNLIANLPSYFNLQEADWNGVNSILEILSKLEGLEIPLIRLEAMGKRQYDGVTREVHASEKMAAMVNTLEEQYDQQEAREQEEKETKLPPGIQKAINEIMDRG
jgi:hypothetical protein